MYLYTVHVTYCDANCFIRGGTQLNHPFYRQLRWSVPGIACVSSQRVRMRLSRQQIRLISISPSRTLLLTQTPLYVCSHDTAYIYSHILYCSTTTMRREMTTTTKMSHRPLQLQILPNLHPQRKARQGSAFRLKIFLRCRPPQPNQPLLPLHVAPLMSLWPTYPIAVHFSLLLSV